ncbi:MAG TPA: hypothetical protein PLS12_01960 [Bacteroidales bacterium]|jgi:hypothetical protein|nr:hypothetical protein [Bacteroidales bacterium]
MEILFKVIKFIINPFTIKTKNKNVALILNYILPILIGIFILLYHFIFYSYQFELSPYKIYSENKIDSLNFVKTINIVNTKLQEKEININSNISLFFSSSDKNYFKSNFFTGKYTAAKSYWILNRIVISPSDLKNDILKREIDTFKMRKISDIIVHEITHIYMRQKLGVFKSFFLETWKKEGYCEYIANSSTINIDYAKNVFINYSKEQVRAIIDKRDFHSHIYEYFKYRLKVDYLLAYKGVDFDTFIETDYNVDELEKEIREDLISGNYKFEKQL